ncbi:MAG: hypothetical protein IIX96_01055 [Clostridia bacterium]|nr:hypothetical protein [Clostridia bacterium]
MDKKLRHCSFCGRSEEEVSLLIPSKDMDSYICDTCIGVCSEFLESQFAPPEEESEEFSLTFESLPKPQQIRMGFQ